MTTTEAIRKLELLLQKATNRNLDDIDITALDGFCTTIQSDTSLSIHATKLLANRLQSSDTTESLYALSILEESMKTCGPEFQSEIGKFRFLNDLCMLVSTKYKGNNTPNVIKDKILDLLLLWTVQYPHLTKVKEIYDMLRTQGVLHEPIKNVAADHRRHVPNITESRPAEDETSQRLRILAQSKDPTDIKVANLLIQSMVKENERTDQMKSFRLLELQRVRETVNVLNDMLDQYDSINTTDGELSTIKELYTVCENLQPTIIRLAQETQGNEESLGDILDASNQLNNAFERYKKILIEYKLVPVKNIPLDTNSHGSAGNSDTRTTSVALLDILGEPLVASTQNINLKTDESIYNNTIESISSELSDIFTSTKDILTPDQINQARDKYEDPTFSILNQFSTTVNGTSPFSSIKPIIPIETQLSLKKSSVTIPRQSPGIPDLDLLVTDMLQSTLNKQKFENNVATKSESNIHLVNKHRDNIVDIVDNDDKILNCDIHLNNPNDKILQLNDNINDEFNSTPKVIQDNLLPPPKINFTSEFKTLTDIEIDLEQITPSSIEPRIVMNDVNGLKIVLNFVADHPRPDVSGIVVTVINQGPKPISSFQFNASISKFCRLRLLPASSNSLPGCKPFRPPSDDITQVLLYSNQHNLDNVDLVCILSYCVGDDPDPINESIGIKNLPKT